MNENESDRFRTYLRQKPVRCISCLVKIFIPIHTFSTTAIYIHYIYTHQRPRITITANYTNAEVEPWLRRKLEFVYDHYLFIMLEECMQNCNASKRFAKSNWSADVGRVDKQGTDILIRSLGCIIALRYRHLSPLSKLHHSIVTDILIRCLGYMIAS